jgi:hypothetical protein
MVGAGIEGEEIGERGIHPAVHQVKRPPLVRGVAVEGRPPGRTRVEQLVAAQDRAGVHVHYVHVIFADVARAGRLAVVDPLQRQNMDPARRFVDDRRAADASARWVIVIGGASRHAVPPPGCRGQKDERSAVRTRLRYQPRRNDATKRDAAARPGFSSRFARPLWVKNSVYGKTDANTRVAAR